MTSAAAMFTHAVHMCNMKRCCWFSGNEAPIDGPLGHVYRVSSELLYLEALGG